MRMDTGGGSLQLGGELRILYRSHRSIDQLMQVESAKLNDTYKTFLFDEPASQPTPRAS
jgi:hypothetical protein